VLIFSVVLLDIIGIGVIFPIIPDLLKEVGIDQTASAAFWGGLLSSSYAFMQFVFSPTIGTLSDIFGRRPVLLIASLLLGIDYLLMGFAENILILFIGRIIGGLAGGTIATGTAYLADISDTKDKKKNFAIIGAAFGLGFILGPIIGGLMGEISVRAPFFLSALLSFLNFFLCLFLLPETLRLGTKNKFRVKKLNPFFNLSYVIKIPLFKGLFFCFFLIAFANTVYPAIWSFWGREVFGWSSGMIGFTLACYGFLLFIVQAFVIRL
jgi:DHA1 family tetracycline resistance protein-like MFS transporter